MSLTGEVTKFQKRRAGETDSAPRTTEFLTIMIGQQMFGIPVMQVQDVLRQQNVTRVPLAPAEVAGALNLRGRIVTAINVRCRLGLEDLPAGTKTMAVVVEHENELYSLIIDKVGDVLSLHNRDFEQIPPTMDDTWREIATGIYRLDKQLLIVADIARLLRHSVH
ncbi:MAG: chemotaxis protein CheW [Rhodospirillales bacterium]|nr:chemotaxis protein CheW [Alphaproteobacteria bacterium]MCB9987066.1 chemotaxis protein CheW [Rhodospirillales bacterium]USO08169.1 MAG: chemotaxis protein CheW [Rhodospirillales bacterium]